MEHTMQRDNVKWQSGQKRQAASDWWSFRVVLLNALESIAACGTSTMEQVLSEWVTLCALPAASVSDADCAGLFLV